MKRVAYLLTSRKGLPAFVYEELKAAHNFEDISVTPYIFRRGKGPYMPEPEWGAKYVTLVSLITGFLFLIPTPWKLLKLIKESIIQGLIIDAIIAIGMYRSVKNQSIKHVIAFEGLHGLRIAYILKLLLPELIVSVIVHAEMIRLEGKKLRVTRRILESVERIVSPTELNCHRIAEKFQYPISKIHFNRMSVNTSSYKRSEKFRILIVGFWAERKGHETLFKAIQLLDTETIEVHVIGGDVWGGEGFDVKAYVEKNGLQHVIKLHGKVNDDTKKYFLNTCDLFVLPCRTPKSGIIEGLPVSLMEAMSFSKPVLSTFHSATRSLKHSEIRKKQELIGMLRILISSKEKRTQSRSSLTGPMSLVCSSECQSTSFSKAPRC